MDDQNSKSEEGQERHLQAPLASPRTAAVTSGFEDLGINAGGRDTEASSLGARLEMDNDTKQDLQSDPSQTVPQATSGNAGDEGGIHDDGEEQFGGTIKLGSSLDTQEQPQVVSSARWHPEASAEKTNDSTESNNGPSTLMSTPFTSIPDSAKESSTQPPEPTTPPGSKIEAGCIPASLYASNMVSSDTYASAIPLSDNEPRMTCAASTQVNGLESKETTDAKSNDNINPFTWQDFEITGHLMLDPQDDGYGMNGIGFQPTRQQAATRLRKRKQQIADWRANEAKEARDKRSLKRRQISDWDAEGSDDDSDYRKAKSRRTVRFAIDSS